HAAVEQRAKAASVPITRIGATGGRGIVLGEERPLLLEALVDSFEGWLPSYMAEARERLTWGRMPEGHEQMKRSTDRIITTHSGSLSRPPDLLALNRARAQGEKVDEAAYE